MDRHGPCPPGPSGRLDPRARCFHHSGGSIRTLSVSLLAVAAIATSLILARKSQDKPGADQIPAGEPAPAEQSLDVIRAAGL